jgi:hypothetical protein
MIMATIRADQLMSRHFRRGHHTVLAANIMLVEAGARSSLSPPPSGLFWRSRWAALDFPRRPVFRRKRVTIGRRPATTQHEG